MDTAALILTGVTLALIVETRAQIAALRRQLAAFMKRPLAAPSLTDLEEAATETAIEAVKLAGSAKSAETAIAGLGDERPPPPPSVTATSNGR